MNPNLNEEALEERIHELEGYLLRLRRLGDGWTVCLDCGTISFAEYCYCEDDS